MTIIKDEDLFC